MHTSIHQSHLTQLTELTGHAILVSVNASVKRPLLAVRTVIPHTAGPSLGGATRSQVSLRRQKNNLLDPIAHTTAHIGGEVTTRDRTAVLLITRLHVLITAHLRVAGPTTDQSAR